MRLIMSPEEARALIAKIPKIPGQKVECQNQRMISDQYEASLSSHKCEDLISLIRTIYVRNKKATDSGKKPAQVDERYMKRAKDLFYGELAAALGINFKDVEPYIKDTVESMEVTIM